MNKPSIEGNLSWANGHYQSVRGKISSNWWRFGDDFYLSIEIFVNTRATVYIPEISMGRQNIYEGQSLLVRGNEAHEKSDGFKFLRKENRHFIFEVGSGKYDFVVKQ